jgi:hypothetical protein
LLEKLRTKSENIKLHNGLDYTERTWKKQRLAKEKEIEQEKRMREEVMRGTHWIDLDSVNEEMIGSDGEPVRNVTWNPTPPLELVSEETVSTRILPAANLGNIEDVVPATCGESGASIQNRKSNLGSNALGFALGASMCGVGYGLWKFLTAIQSKREEIVNDETEVAEEADILLTRRKRSVREWNKDFSSTKSKF